MGAFHSFRIYIYNVYSVEVGKRKRLGVVTGVRKPARVYRKYFSSFIQNFIDSYHRHVLFIYFSDNIIIEIVPSIIFVSDLITTTTATTFRRF